MTSQQHFQDSSAYYIYIFFTDKENATMFLKIVMRYTILKNHLTFITKKHAWIIKNRQVWKEENHYINYSSRTYQNLETPNSPEAYLSNSEENNEDKEDPTTVLSSIAIKMDDRFQMKKAQPQTFPQYPSRWALGSKWRRAIGSILWN